MDDLELFRNRILEKTSNSPLIVDNVVFIGVVGSFAENEAIEDFSDLDCLIVMDHIGPVYAYERNLVPLIELLEGYYGIVSFLTHSLFDLNSYVSTPYLISYSLAKPIYQSPRWDLWTEISSIIRKRNFTAKNNRRYQLYMVRHDRFNIFRKIRTDPSLQDLWVINSQLFDQLRWIAQFHGYFSQSKVSMLRFLKDGSYLSADIITSIVSHFKNRDAFFTKNRKQNPTKIAKEYFATLCTLEDTYNYFLDRYEFMGPIPEERISM